MKENILQSYIDLHVSKEILSYTPKESIKESIEFKFWHFNKAIFKAAETEFGMKETLEKIQLGLMSSLARK